MATAVPSNARSRASALQWLTIGHALLEGVAALYAAYLAGSVALLSFGLDSFVEVTSAAIVLWRISARGSQTISERGGLRLVGICFLVLAVTVGYEAIGKLTRQEKPGETWLGIAVAIVSVLGMPVLASMKRRVSGQIGSDSMRADARQTDFCFVLASILLLGLGCYRLFGWWWVDPVAGLAMAPIIAWEGVRAFQGHSCGCSGETPAG